MKILLWAPFGAGTHYWGPGTSAYRLYKKNKNKDIKVTLVHGSSFQNKFEDVFDEQIRLGEIDKKNLISYISFLINSYKWIKKNHQYYDVFHGLTAFFYTFIPAMFFVKYDKPSFIKISGINGGFENNGFLSKISGFSYYRRKNANRITGYFSISSDITRSLVKNGIDHKKIYYIPNGVDTEVFYPPSNENKIILRNKYTISDKFTVIYLGGLTRNKNVLESVYAVSELYNRGFDIQFLIVGPDRSDGIIEKEIHNYIKNNNLESVIIHINYTDKPEVYLKISDVFVLNSRFEGLSNSLLEAMATGLPCIAYPASGTIDLIENEITGFISNGESKDIVNRLSELYKNRDLYLKISENSLNKIDKSFTSEQMLSKHIKVFKDTKIFNNA